MIKSLDQLYKLGDYIYFDYETGTFTKSCSRYVLEYLSRDDLLKKLLLDKNKNVKEKLKQKYNFKSFREMYEAINKIKSSDFFAINITINFEKKDNVISEKIIDDIIQITKETTYENKKKLLDGMDRLSITHLFAYWNIGKKHSYPENLSKCFDFWNKDYYFGDDGYLLSKIDSDFLANLQKGLYICGQRTHYNYIKNLNNDQK